MTNTSYIPKIYLRAAYVDVLDTLFALLTVQFNVSFRQWPAGSTRIREIREFTVKLNVSFDIWN
jgi:hypothetical protein